MNSYAPTTDLPSFIGKKTSLFKVQKRSAAVSSSLEVDRRSNYQRVPTENVKFEKFIELLFKSRIQSEDIKLQIVKYVQALETNYMEIVQELKNTLNKERNQQRKTNGEQANAVADRSELEAVFVSCIEEVRKDIMKRRLKTELVNKKSATETSVEAKQFEESLMRLVQLAKNKVKIKDFTQKDKYNLLDLFVNNEKTLLKIYEALFPQKQLSLYPIGQAITATANSSKATTMYRSQGGFVQNTQINKNMMNITIDSVNTHQQIPLYGSQLFHKSKKVLASSMNANLGRDNPANAQITITNKLLLEAVARMPNSSLPNI